MAYLELLDIDDSAGADEIRIRTLDRHNYFKTLAGSAPTAQLKAIYEKKIADLEILAKRYDVSFTAKSRQEYKQAATVGSDVEQTDMRAHLVLHTEGRVARAFPLVLGINIIGRKGNFFPQAISLDDEYMSKVHAVVEVVSIKDQLVLLYDAEELSNQKPSTNGIFLNGNEPRIRGKIKLKNDDTFQVGYSQLVLAYGRVERTKEVVEAVTKREHSKTIYIKVH